MLLLYVWNICNLGFMFIAEIEVVAIAEVPILRLSYIGLRFPRMLQLVKYSLLAKRSSHTISSQQQELSGVQIFSSPTFCHMPQQSMQRAQFTILLFNNPSFILCAFKLAHFCGNRIIQGHQSRQSTLYSTSQGSCSLPSMKAKSRFYTLSG